MAGYWLPGPLCLMLNALAPAVGVPGRTSVSSPGSVGTGGGQKGLSESDYQFIRDSVGRTVGRKVVSLNALRLLHASHVREYTQAVREFGRHSWAAEWQQAIVAHLEELISEAESPRGKATKKLKKLLEGPIKPAELKKAIAEVLGDERQRQLAGHSDDGGQETMTLFGEAVQAILKFNKTALAQAIEKAKHPGSKVSDADLSKAVGNVLGAERTKQLLGLSDDDTSGPDAMELVSQALEVSHHRHLESLKHAIEKAKRPGNKVSDKDLKKAIGEVLGTERQMQLLGLPEEDTSGENAMGLVTQALEVSHKRHLASLKSLIAKAKHPGNTVSHKDIQKAVVQALSSERQRELLGGSSDQEFSDLLSAAAKVQERKLSAPARRRTGKLTVTIGQIRLIPRIQ